MPSTTWKWATAVAASVLVATGTGTMIAVSHQGPPPEAKAPMNQPAKKVRSATIIEKVKTQQVLLYPELVEKNINMMYATLQKEWEELPPIQNDIPLERGIEHIEVERILTFKKGIEYQRKIIESGTWDAAFFESMSTGLLLPLQWKISQADRVKWAKTIVSQLLYLEEFAHQRVFVGQNLRPSVYYQVQAIRMTAELAYAETLAKAGME